jgi:hypothetical protein
LPCYICQHACHVRHHLTMFRGVDNKHRLIIISPGTVWYMAWLPSVAVAGSLLDKAYLR